MQVVANSSAHFLRYRRAVRWTPEKIRERREDLGLTQLELAKRLRVSLRSVTAWEAGDSRPQRPSKLDEVLGRPDQRARDHLAAKGTAVLVAEINERLTELARRVPDERRTRANAPTLPDLDSPDSVALGYDDMPDVDLGTDDQAADESRREG